MRYRDSMEKSAEYLHLALQLMTRHSTAPHPVCYAVWYEYVAGANPVLNAAIDLLKAQDGVLDDNAIRALYREHVVVGSDNGALPSYQDENRREIEKLRGEVLRAREDALADGLTGLLNRRGFDLAFEDCLVMNRCAGGPSLLIADIDHFKRINDCHGHLFGDRVIRAVAKILRDNVKGRDVAARYGGEEFIVLLPDTPLRGARLLAEKIRAAIAHHRFRRVDDKDAGERITISIGVTHYRVGEAPVDFFERADSALYASKTNGRNRVTVAEAVATG